MSAFGERLRRERERRKVTLEEISLSTKISIRLLTALETEKFEQLPGGIFNKGFVRAYARFLGMDEQEAIDGYLAAAGELTPAAEERDAHPPEEPSAVEGTMDRLPWGVLTAALVVVALGFAVWGWRSRSEQAPAPARVSARPAAAAEHEPERSTERTPEQQAAPRVEPIAGKGDGARLTVAANAVAPNAAAANAPGALASTGPAPAASSAVMLKIHAREDAWVSVSADGKKLFDELMPANAERSVSAQKQIEMRVGNAGALDLSLNGKALAALGDYGEVKTLIVDAVGIRPAPRAPAAVTPVAQ